MAERYVTVTARQQPAAHTASAGGKSMPAVPVLQRKPKEQEEISLESPQADLQKSAGLAVAQRTPAIWARDAYITRILTLERSGTFETFSKWKKVKDLIGEYQALQDDQYMERGRILRAMREKAEDWFAAHPVPANGVEDAKVTNIRTEIPGLIRFIAAEEKTTAEDAYYSRDPVTLDQSVPRELKAGIGRFDSEDVKARTLFNNFNNNLRFNYIGAAVNVKIAIVSRTGDCVTLAGLYIYVAEQLGINAVLGQRQATQLGPARAVNGRNTVGNTHGETHWYFQNHYWAIVNGVNYDLLYKAINPAPPALVASEATYNEVNYTIFTNGCCVIGTSERDKLTADTIQGQGRVFTTEDDAKGFIDGNKIVHQ
ncbi:hypothetical protein ACFGVR_19165 [Mucilaginibacter sp. AW1-3]